MENCATGGVSIAEKQSLRMALHFLQAVLLSLLYFIGNAYIDARFMMLGQLVLAQYLPKALDPSRTFKATPIDFTYEVACYGVWIVGVPSLLATTTAVACTLDECTAEQSSRPAERWLGACVQLEVPPFVWSIVGNAWAVLAGPMGVWMQASFGSSSIEGARGLDAGHAALAMLAGRVLKISCQFALTSWKGSFVQRQVAERGEAERDYMVADRVEKGLKR
ncbi:hypothetical protein C8Q80DRAFT_704212 [Daedaleopsis nitida]|nr:hypothetical protein C8Q80DRAFT_704212 [Daedaleopsis nitida]